MRPHGFPGSSAGKESTCNTGDPDSILGLGLSPGAGKGYPLQCSKESTYNAGDLGSIPGLGRSLGEENGYPPVFWRREWTEKPDGLQSMGLQRVRRDWVTSAFMVKKFGRCWFRKDSLEKGMATHSSILTWTISWAQEPGRLESIGVAESDMTQVT